MTRESTDIILLKNKAFDLEDKPLSELLERMQQSAYVHQFEAIDTEVFDIFLQSDLKNEYRLCNARINDKRRLFYTTRTLPTGEQFIITIDVMDDHKYETNPLMTDKTHQTRMANEIEHSIQRYLDEKKERNKTPSTDNDAEADPYAETEKTIQTPITLTDKQKDIANQQKKVIVLTGGPSVGKTTTAEEWLRKFKDTVADSHMLYATKNKELADKMAERFVPDFIPTSDLDTIHTMIAEILAIDINTQPAADNHTFLEWRDELITHFKKSNKKIPAVLNDPIKLNTEFTRVITNAFFNGETMSIDSPYLTAEQYLQLGAKLSNFSEDDKKEVYDLFRSYQGYLSRKQVDDVNARSHSLLTKLKAYKQTEAGKAWFEQYALKVLSADEIQQLHIWDLYLLMELVAPDAHLFFTGDAAQAYEQMTMRINDPLTQLFRFHGMKESQFTFTHLTDNHRNSQQVAELVNILRKTEVKHWGSDESMMLLASVCTSKETGELKANVYNNNHTSHIETVVLVPDAQFKTAEQKAMYHKKFGPNVFAISTTGGREWNHVILYGFFDHYRDLMKLLKTLELATADETIRGRKIHGSMKVSQALQNLIHGLILAASRAKISFEIVEEKSIDQFIVSLLNAVRPESAPAQVQTQPAPKPKETPLQWLAYAEENIKENAIEQAESILLSIQVWDTESNVALLKNIFNEMKSELSQKISMAKKILNDTRWKKCSASTDTAQKELALRAITIQTTAPASSTPKKTPASQAAKTESPKAPASSSSKKQPVKEKKQEPSTAVEAKLKQKPEQPVVQLPIEQRMHKKFMNEKNPERMAEYVKELMTNDISPATFFKWWFQEQDGIQQKLQTRNNYTDFYKSLVDDPSSILYFVMMLLHLFYYYVDDKMQTELKLMPIKQYKKIATDFENLYPAIEALSQKRDALLQPKENFYQKIEAVFVKHFNDFKFSNSFILKENSLFDIKSSIEKQYKQSPLCKSILFFIDTFVKTSLFANLDLLEADDIDDIEFYDILSHIRMHYNGFYPQVSECLSKEKGNTKTTYISIIFKKMMTLLNLEISCQEDMGFIVSFLEVVIDNDVNKTLISKELFKQSLLELLKLISHKLTPQYHDICATIINLLIKKYGCNDFGFMGGSKDKINDAYDCLTNALLHSIDIENAEVLKVVCDLIGGFLKPFDHFNALITISLTKDINFYHNMMLVFLRKDDVLHREEKIKIIIPLLYTVFKHHYEISPKEAIFQAIKKLETMESADWLEKLVETSIDFSYEPYHEMHAQLRFIISKIIGMGPVKESVIVTEQVNHFQQLMAMLVCWVKLKPAPTHLCLVANVIHKIINIYDKKDYLSLFDSIRLFDFIFSELGRILSSNEKFLDFSLLQILYRCFLFDEKSIPDSRSLQFLVEKQKYCDLFETLLQQFESYEHEIPVDFMEEKPSLIDLITSARVEINKNVSVTALPSGLFPPVDVPTSTSNVVSEPIDSKASR